MRKVTVLLALTFSLLLSACASPPTPIIVVVTATPEAGPEVFEPSPTAPRSDTIEWDRASLYVGEFKTVCGPVISTRYASSSSGQPTFLNIGRAYPDPNRFTVVIWGRNRGNFPFKPEDYYSGKTICVTGLIEEYRGVPEIEISSPSQIEIE